MNDRKRRATIFDICFLSSACKAIKDKRVLNLRAVFSLLHTFEVTNSETKGKTTKREREIILRIDRRHILEKKFLLLTQVKIESIRSKDVFDNNNLIKIQDSPSEK